MSEVGSVPVWTSWLSTSAGSCSWVRAILGSNAGCGVKGLRVVLGGTDEWKIAVEQSVYFLPRRVIASWVPSKEAWSEGWGRWFYHSAVLQWNSTWSNVPSSEVLSTRQTGTRWSRSRGNGQRMQHLAYGKRPRELGLVSLGFDKTLLRVFIT